jgi:exonuclease III
MILGFKLSIVNVYLPNDAVERNEFIEDLTMRLNMSNPFVLCGDFNFIMDFELDRHAFNQSFTHRSKRSYHTTSVRTFENLMQIYKLVDVYRAMEPAGREYTFYNEFYKTGTRLDRIYISRLNADCLLHVEHLPIVQSDHRAISLELKWEGRKLGRGYWKCNVSTLKDQFFY